MISMTVRNLTIVIVCFPVLLISAPSLANVRHSLNGTAESKLPLAVASLEEDYRAVEAAALANMPEGTETGTGSAIVGQYAIVHVFNKRTGSTHVLLKKSDQTWKRLAIKKAFTISDLKKYGMTQSQAQNLLDQMRQL